MSWVKFEPAGVEVWVEPGTRLIDVADENPDTDIPFSCRAANCGTCRVQVVEGMDAFDPPGDEEQQVLEWFGDEPNVRLCCQLRLARPRAAIIKVVDK